MFTYTESAHTKGKKKREKWMNFPFSSAVLFCCIALLLYLRSMKWKKLLHAITLYSVYKKYHHHHHRRNDIAFRPIFFHHLSQSTIKCKNLFFWHFDGRDENSKFGNSPIHLTVVSILQFKKVRFYLKKTVNNYSELP